MKKSLICSLFFLPLLCFGQVQKKQIVESYTEAPDPQPKKVSDWNHLTSGLHASVVSIDKQFEKGLIPVSENRKDWTGTAWRGERLSAQIVLWNNDAAGVVKCVFSDFKSKNGRRLPAGIARARFVRYVIADEFGAGCGARKPQDYVARLCPDVLDHVDRYKMEPQSTRPVWISIDVPADAISGTYTSTMQLLVDGKKLSKFTWTVEVLGRTLPPASKWKFHLDLWQNPYSVARVNGVKPWSEGHWTALRPLMKMLAGAGQKVITTTLNNRPWGGQTEDAYDSMIAWKKNINGTWSYDYTLFDNWVKFMMDLGIKNQINCYSMVPWGNELYYFDEVSGKELKVKAVPGTKEHVELWSPFLRDFVAHLTQKGWVNITRIAMDERSPAEMKATLNLLAEVAPQLGVAIADNNKSYKTYPDQLKDLSVAFGAVLDPQDRKYRNDKGFVTSWYVCCSDSFPNVFTFSEPAEGTFIGWYTMAAGFDGFLRWAYNSWVKEPLLDSRFRTWPSGDTYIVYPDGRSSIRFERLMEGIQDAEKIRILREEFVKSSTVEAKEKLQKLNETVKEFNVTKKPDNYQGMIERGKTVLVELAK